MKSKMKRNTAGVLAGILLGTAFLGGCSNPVSTILEKPVFKVGKESCSREDARAILMNYQKEYSNLYGIDQRSDLSTDGTGLYVGCDRF